MCLSSMYLLCVIVLSNYLLEGLTKPKKGIFGIVSAILDFD